MRNHMCSRNRRMHMFGHTFIAHSYFTGVRYVCAHVELKNKTKNLVSRNWDAFDV